MAGFRKKRLEELIKRIIGDALIKEIKDPRIGFATIHRVDLARDYSVADVYVSVIGTEGEKKKAIGGLKKASGYIRHILGKNLRLRIIPHLNFHLDSSIEDGVNLVDMIERANKGTSDDHDDYMEEDDQE